MSTGHAQQTNANQIIHSFGFNQYVLNLLNVMNQYVMGELLYCFDTRKLIYHMGFILNGMIIFPNNSDE